MKRLIIILCSIACIAMPVIAANYSAGTSGPSGQGDLQYKNKSTGAVQAQFGTTSLINVATVTGAAIVGPVTGDLTGDLTGSQPVVPNSSVATNFTLTSADFGTLVMVPGAVTNAITLPTNGWAAGSWIDVATGVGSTDATAVTISAATADTLVGPHDQDLDSVTWGSGHRINAYAKFWSDGSFWHVQNLGGTTMTYTD